MTSDEEILLLSLILISIIILFISSLLLWILRCRRRRQQKREETSKRQQSATTFTHRKVHEVKEKPSKQQHCEVEQDISMTNSSKQLTKQPEENHKTTSNAGDIAFHKRNKNLDSVSVTAAANETFPRNDSKNNVFPIEKIEEIDLNPGLNSPLNLETI